MNISNFKRIAVITILLMSAIIAFGAVSVSAASLTATAKVNSEEGAVLRKSASTTSKQLTIVKDNAKITIRKEVFTSKTKYDKTHKWYYVDAGKKTGYIRSDLVDNIKYSTSSKGETTDALNYRQGAGTEMPIIGTLRNGAAVTKVLTAKASGSSDTWYKIKKDGKYYYVYGKYVKSTSSSSKDTETKETSSGVKFTKSSDLTYPMKDIPLIIGQPFTLKGTISCNKTIEKVRVGIMQNGSWLAGVNVTVKDVNSKTFDLSSVDDSIKFGNLKKGTYYYRVNVMVDGKWNKKVVHKEFKVIALSSDSKKWADQLAKTAIALAWPAGTSEDCYTLSSDTAAATPEFVNAFNSVYPTHDSWGNKYTRVGADCGVFISTVVRYSGYDTNLLYNLTGEKSMFNYFPTATDKWVRVAYTGLESELQNGDIILYHKDSGGQHVLMYVKIEGVGYMVEAANTGSDSTSSYGHTSRATKKIFTLDNKGDDDTIFVYRACVK